MRLTRTALAAVVAVLATSFTYAAEEVKPAAPAAAPVAAAPAAAPVAAAPAAASWIGTLKTVKNADKVSYVLTVNEKTTVTVTGSEEVLKVAATLDGKKAKVTGALKDAVVTATKIEGEEAPKAEEKK